MKMLHSNCLSTALVSCDLTGTTSAFCHARATQTIFVKGPLPSKDMKWMDVPITTMSPEPAKTAESLIVYYKWLNPAVTIFSFVFLFCLIYFTLLRFCFVSSLSI